MRHLTSKPETTFMKQRNQNQSRGSSVQGSRAAKKAAAAPTRPILGNLKQNFVAERSSAAPATSKGLSMIDAHLAKLSSLLDEEDTKKENE